MERKLTDRQLEVLQLKAKRFTNSEIAEKLVISITTVKWHVRQIYNILGTNNRTETVSLAREIGLLPEKSLPVRQLPQPLTPFIGRKQELHKLISLLEDSNVHLVTLLGPGGIGKTRLALKAIESLQNKFGDGICWVNFSGLDQPDRILTTVNEYIASSIIESLGISLQTPNDPNHLLLSYLAEREILITFDSFEQLSFGAEYFSELLQGAPKCKILVTSRERLQIRGEVVYLLQGLSTRQKENENITSNDAVDLFLHTANRISSNEKLGEEMIPAIQRICSRLEGMPLAIELAAEWTRLLPVEQIEQEMDRGLEFLDPRSTSIRSMFDVSWSFLTEHQRESFSRIAVFQRDFSREAAKKVAGADLITLRDLIDKSLIKKAEEGRFTLHDLMRQYAAEHLAARQESEATRDAHCAYFAALVEGQKEAVISGDHSKILADLDNIRSAWYWAVKHKQWENLNKMLFTLDWFYNLRAFYVEAITMLNLVIDALNKEKLEGLKSILYGNALVHSGFESAWVYGSEKGFPLIFEGLEVLRKNGEDEHIAWPQILALLMGIYRNDLQTNEQKCLECLDIFTRLEDPYGISFSLVVLSTHYRHVGRFLEAQQAVERALAISRLIEDPQGIAHALRNLGFLHFILGDYEASRNNFREEATLWHDLSLLRLHSQTIRSIGETYIAEGKFVQAEDLLLESLAGFKQVEDKANMLHNLFILGHIALQQKKIEQALGFLQDAQAIIEIIQDTNEQARWWHLSGRIYMMQDKMDAARFAFCRSLENHSEINSQTLIQIFIEFVVFYQQSSNNQIAARLLGFIQSQNSLSANIRHNKINPLYESLVTVMTEENLNALLKEGAAFSQQGLVDLLLLDCG